MSNQTYIQLECNLHNVKTEQGHIDKKGRKGLTLN